MTKFIWFIGLLIGILLLLFAFLPPAGQGISLMKALLALILIVISYNKVAG